MSIISGFRASSLVGDPARGEGTFDGPFDVGEDGIMKFSGENCTLTLRDFIHGSLADGSAGTLTLTRPLPGGALVSSVSGTGGTPEKESAILTAPAQHAYTVRWSYRCPPGKVGTMKIFGSSDGMNAALDDFAVGEPANHDSGTVGLDFSDDYGVSASCPWK